MENDFERLGSHSSEKESHSNPSVLEKEYSREGEDLNDQYEQEEDEDNSNQLNERDLEYEDYQNIDLNKNEESESEDRSKLNEYQSEDDNSGGEMDESNEIDEDQYDMDEMREEVIELLAPERKVRYRILKFINKLRNEYKLNEFNEDNLGNLVAMSYAEYLLRSLKENESEAMKLYSSY